LLFEQRQFSFSQQAGDADARCFRVQTSTPFPLASLFFEWALPVLTFANGAQLFFSHWFAAAVHPSMLAPTLGECTIPESFRGTENLK
jgi:hypothetical protein